MVRTNAWALPTISLSDMITPKEHSTLVLALLPICMVAVDILVDLHQLRTHLHNSRIVLHMPQLYLLLLFLIVHRVMTAIKEKAVVQMIIIADRLRLRRLSNLATVDLPPSREDTGNSRVSRHMGASLLTQAMRNLFIPRRLNPRISSPPINLHISLHISPHLSRIKPRILRISLPINNHRINHRTNSLPTSSSTNNHSINLNINNSMPRHRKVVVVGQTMGEWL